MSNKKRIVLAGRDLVIAGFGGSFRHPLASKPSGWWRSLLGRVRRLLRRQPAPERRILLVR